MAAVPSFCKRSPLSGTTRSLCSSLWGRNLWTAGEEPSCIRLPLLPPNLATGSSCMGRNIKSHPGSLEHLFEQQDLPGLEHVLLIFAPGLHLDSSSVCPSVQTCSAALTAGFSFCSWSLAHFRLLPMVVPHFLSPLNE